MEVERGGGRGEEIFGGREGKVTCSGGSCGIEECMAEGGQD